MTYNTYSDDVILLFPLSVKLATNQIDESLTPHVVFPATITA
jgi:hypothetical protein